MKKRYSMHANIIRFALLLLCASIQVSVWGQIREVRNVPTPEVSNLGTFGSVPVGHYTGTPNISVPLYTMKVGKLSIPLQAMYHTANVKPHVPPTCLGIGWALSAGGYISRSVKGCQDEKYAGSHQLGYYFNHSRINDIENSPNKPQQLITSAKLSEQYTIDLSADEFTFNFNGYSGTFFMDKDGDWRVISDDNIKVEFNEWTDLITFDTLKDRLKQRYKYKGTILSGYNGSANNRFFDKFTLITPDGTRYEFGGGNATEYCIPYYNQANGDIMATCWRLSKITTIDQRVVTFEYAADTYMVDIHYAPQMIRYYIDGTPSDNTNTGKTGYSGFLMMPSRLTKISYDEETVSFNYERHSNYGQHFIVSDLNGNDKLGCLYWNYQGDFAVRYVHYLRQEITDCGFTLFLGIDPLEYNYSENLIRNKIASKITQDYLKTITVHKSGIKILWIDFIMTKIMNRRLLSGVNFISTEPRSVKDDAGGFDGFSYSLAVSVNSKNEDASGRAVFEPVSMYNNVKQYEYRFDYYLGDNQKDLWPIASPLIYTDSWGYYSTAKSQWEIASDGAKVSDYKLRPASLESTRKFVLKSIKYPTGGKTVFDYELNDYSKVFNLQTPSVTDEQGTSGGLRVKTLSNFDASDNLLYYKQYTYRNSNGKSSGISKGTPVFYDHINFNSDGTNFIDFYSYDDINPYPMNFNTPSVGYSTILETLYDANGHVLTTTEYQYTNYDADINNNAHMDVRADYAANVFGNRNYACAAFTSLAFERGKLVSKKVMDGQANVLEKCTYEYNRVAGNAYTTVSQEFYNAVVEEQHTTRQLALSYMYKTYTNRYLVSVSKKEETMNNGKYITEQRYEYNNYGLPSKKTVISNNGERLQTSYSYNSDYHGSKNLILPAEVEERKDNGISNIVYHYDDSNMGVPYVSKQESLWSYANYGSSPFKVRTDYTVDRVDQYGNPIIWNQQGVKTVMVWSFKGQRLIASIQKASCDEVVAALGKNPEEYSALNNTTLSLDFLRTALPNALVYTYQYDNRLNLISKTDPNGLIHTYTYDSLNRLTSEYRKYNNKTELLKTYQYNFKTK